MQCVKCGNPTTAADSIAVRVGNKRRRMCSECFMPAFTAAVEAVLPNTPEVRAALAAQRRADEEGGHNAG